jgi:hypothetical protein
MTIKLASVDYKKLAGSNLKLLGWADKVRLHAKDNKDFRVVYGLNAKSNIQKVVRFFKKHKKEAVALLGRKFEREYKSLFYASSVENDLIIQFLPAIHKALNDHKISQNEYDDFQSELMFSLRHSVWMYTRSDIKFTTYAINGIKKNIIYLKIDAAEERVKKNYVLFDDYRGFISDGVETPFEEIAVDNSKPVEPETNFVEFIERVCDEAKLTDIQKEHIKTFYTGGVASKYTFFATRKKLKKYVLNNLETLPRMEDIRLSTDSIKD